MLLWEKSVALWFPFAETLHRGHHLGQSADHCLIPEVLQSMILYLLSIVLLLPSFCLSWLEYLFWILFYDIFIKRLHVIHDCIVSFFCHPSNVISDLMLVIVTDTSQGVYLDHLKLEAALFLQKGCIVPHEDGL